jgi:hypothetical protein
MRLRVSDRVFTRSRSGTVIACVWLSNDRIAFPAEEWDDFATAITSAFAEAVARVAGGTRDVTVHFMEGPFTVQLAGEGPDILRLRGFENGLGGTVRFDERVRMLEFGLSVQEAASSLLRWCHQRDWCGRDEDELTSGLAVLRKVTRQSTH